MIGIVSYGGYIPRYRLSREEIKRAWGGSSMGGEKAVANYDEDSLTMAVAAGLDCITGLESNSIGGLYFATTTSPYKEKQVATTAALALDLPQQIRTADFTNSLRAGTTALSSALDAVANGAGTILVTAADCRPGAPKGQYEQLLGDGAAAILVGNKKVIAEIIGSHHVSNELMDVWRGVQDVFVHWWEERFILNAGYQTVLRESILHLMKKYSMSPGDFTKVVLYAPNPKIHITLAESLGFNKNQVQDPLFSTVGNTGTASVPMMLVAALEEAKPGDKLLVVSYGDGCDAYILKVTDEIKKINNRRGIKHFLKTKKMIENYEKYLVLHKLITTDRDPIIEPMLTSVPVLWRERRKNISFYGTKCKRCGTPQFPPQRICTVCQTKDEMDDYKFADKKGKIFSFTYEYAAPIPEPPLVYGLIDFNEGGRILSEMTDRDVSEIHIGLPVEMTFRKMQIPGAFHDYYWKAKPVRGDD